MLVTGIEVGIPFATNNLQLQEPEAVAIRFFRKHTAHGILRRHIATAQSIEN